jgi:hypothetical protein
MFKVDSVSEDANTLECKYRVIVVCKSILVYNINYYACFVCIVSVNLIVWFILSISLLFNGAVLHVFVCNYSSEDILTIATSPYCSATGLKAIVYNLS